MSSYGSSFIRNEAFFYSFWSHVKKMRHDNSFTSINNLWVDPFSYDRGRLGF